MRQSNFGLHAAYMQAALDGGTSVSITSTLGVTSDIVALIANNTSHIIVQTKQGAHLTFYAPMVQSIKYYSKVSGGDITQLIRENVARTKGAQRDKINYPVKSHYNPKEYNRAAKLSRF